MHLRPTSLRIAKTSSNSELKSKEVVTLAPRRKLQDRGFLSDAAYRKMNTTSCVGRRPRSRRIMAVLPRGMTSAFWTLRIVCSRRRWVWVRLHVVLDLARCTAPNIIGNFLEPTGKLFPGDR
ncbi:MAG: hypothetical protein QOD58_2300 [Mycobacterium sp.]|nr:hypothetical protein [Mycobacterium sp.]